MAEVKEKRCAIQISSSSFSSFFFSSPCDGRIDKDTTVFKKWGKNYRERKKVLPNLMTGWTAVGAAQWFEPWANVRTKNMK